MVLPLFSLRTNAFVISSKRAHTNDRIALASFEGRRLMNSRRFIRRAYPPPGQAEADTRRLIHLKCGGRCPAEYRLPGLAADLVRRQGTGIVGNKPAAKAAKAATQSIPIIFVTGEDPVTTGLVDSLNRPSGNLTGVVFFASGHLGTKRLELMHDLVPKGAVIGVLMDPSFASELPA